MTSILVLLVPVLVIALIVFIFTAARTEGEGGEDMVKKVYIYLVLFVTLMMIIGGSVSTFMAIADIVAPAAYYQSFEDYSYWQKDIERPSGEQRTTELTEEQIRENYDAMVRQENERTRQRAFNNLIKSFGWIIIPLPVFIYFQRRLENKKEI